MGYSSSAITSAPSRFSDDGVLFTTTAIAIDKDKNSQYAVRWAVDNLAGKNNDIILVHVRTQSSQSIQDNHKGGFAETEMHDFFLPYRGFCARKGVRAREVILHDIDITSALVDFIQNMFINVVVLGASNRNALTRAFKNVDVPTSLLKVVPDFCTVYIISKGKIQATKSASQPCIPVSASNSRSEGLYGWSSLMASSQKHADSSRFSTIQKHPVSNPNAQNGNKWSSPHQCSPTNISDCSGSPSFQFSEVSYGNSDISYVSDASRNSVISKSSRDIEAEMTRLKLELKQTMEMYNSACKEVINANVKAKEIDQWKTEEACKLQEAKQAHEAALAQAEIERQKARAAIDAAGMAKRIAELEVQKRMNAETNVMCQEKEKEKAAEQLASPELRYRKYTIEEIELATQNLSSSLKIGEGGYGAVYKAYLDHTAVAIKILGPNMSNGKKQFQQEVEILTYIRHPNMVLLLGACPENGCLVYEYMENGSLEDRIFRKNNTPPIPMKTRFRIAAEISTALLFLHQSKPEPLVHRDLKPANILLDQNYVSKIADVGLARLVPKAVADGVTQSQMTAAAGTFCYIDPEYQQTGVLDVTSDIYSLGIMLLQIITAKPPMGLAHNIGRAIGKGTFLEMLDPAATDWPYEEALSYAQIALRCCELRKKDRPDLGSVVVPELKRLSNLQIENEKQ